MARNRFENYIGNQYQSQFTPTPIDANMAFNVINARQGYYDNIMKSIDMLNPDLEYIAPNQFDQGDLPIANQLYQQRAQEQQKLIDDILKTDNLNDAARRVSKLASDPTYKQTAEALKMRKLQYNQGRKMLEDSYGKDPFYNQYVRWFEQNRLTPFDVTNYGINSAVGAPTPDFDQSLKTISDIMKADKWQTADGSMVERTSDGQYFKTVRGTRERISYEEAYDHAKGWVLADPATRNWVSTLNKIGLDGEAMLEQKFKSFAGAKSYDEMTQEVGYISNKQWDEDSALRQKNNNTEYDYRPAYNFESNEVPPLTIKNGQVVVNEEALVNDPTYQQLKKDVQNALQDRGEGAGARKNAVSQKLQDYVSTTYKKGLADIEARFPNMSNEAKINMLNQAKSGTVYEQVLIDKETGNPKTSETVNFGDFSSGNLYEKTPTGLKAVKKEDLLDNVNSDNNTAGKGKVVSTGINVTASMPSYNYNTPNKEQQSFVSGRVFEINGKQYIAAENSVNQAKRYKPFNDLFSIQYKVKDDFSQGIIETEDYGRIPLVSYKVYELDQNGNKTGRYQTRASKGYYNPDTKKLDLEQINEYTGERYTYSVDPTDEEALRELSNDPRISLSDQEVHEMIKR